MAVDRGRNTRGTPISIEEANAQLAAAGLPPIDQLDQITDPGALSKAWPVIGRTIAQLSPEDQSQVLSSYEGKRPPVKQGKAGEFLDQTLERAAQEARDNAFRNGELLPGVDGTGGGTSLTPEERASVVQGQNIERGNEVLDEVTGDLGNYTYDPTFDQGAGYNLKDGQSYFDEDVDPLILAQEEALKQSRSDTTGVDAQKASLEDYTDAINQGGLTAIDRARIEEMRQSTARRARAQEGAIQAEMAERGRGGGAASMLLRQQAQQEAANQRGLYDTQTAALGLQRKDSLIGARADVGGQVQAGVDAIDRFNTENSQAVVNRNTDRENVGRSTTWQQNQSNANANVTQSNAYNSAQWGEDSARATRNTNTANQAAAFNVGPNQGARGRMRDTLGASQAISGDANAAAGILGQQFTPPGSGDDGSSTAAQLAAIGGAVTPVVAAINPAVGVGVGAASGVAGAVSKKDDEDED